MKVFVGWSGDLSRKVAVVIREQFPAVLQGLDVFLSETDIEAGVPWFAEIESSLADSDYGIIVVTRENQSKPWLNFEAGALANKIGESHVVPLLVDLEVSDMPTGPLVHFQKIGIDREGIEKLLRELNKARDKGLPLEIFNKTFERWWDDIRQGFEDAKASVAAAPSMRRSESEMLADVLTELRNLSERVDSISRAVTPLIPGPVTRAAFGSGLFPPGTTPLTLREPSPDMAAQVAAARAAQAVVQPGGKPDER